MIATQPSGLKPEAFSQLSEEDKHDVILHRLKDEFMAMGVNLISRPDIIRLLIVNLSIEYPDVRPVDVQRSLEEIIQPQIDALFAPITDEEVAKHRESLRALDSPEVPVSSSIFLGPSTDVE